MRSEHTEQKALFQWAKLQENKYPELKLMFAIPNVSYGGTRADMLRGKKLKAEGRKRGIPDICLPIPRGGNCTDEGQVDWYHGLFIEMKFGKNKLSKEQQWWVDNLEQQEYRAVVCYSFEEAKKIILDYLVIKSV